MKLADFGLARSIAQLRQEEGSPILTDYIATRWYRAPEILLGSPHYTFAVDLWSSGEHFINHGQPVPCLPKILLVSSCMLLRAPASRSLHKRTSPLKQSHLLSWTPHFWCCLFVKAILYQVSSLLQPAACLSLCMVSSKRISVSPACAPLPLACQIFYLSMVFSPEASG